MRRLRVLLLTPLLLILAACGATSGTVFDKTHVNGYYLVTYYSCGKSMCPTVMWIPPSWSVIIRQDSDGKVKASEVSEAMYNSCPIGARWVRASTHDDGYCK